MTPKHTRGGARPNAGRPSGEQPPMTRISIRVPVDWTERLKGRTEEIREALRTLLESEKNTNRK